MARLPLKSIGDELNTWLSETEISQHQTAMSDRDEAIAKKVAIARAGWGQKYVDRVHEKKKLTTWERIAELTDDDTQVFEVGSLVNWGVDWQGSRRQAPGAGVVTAFCVIDGKWVIVIANDNTVASGAWWPLTPEKIERAQNMALKLRLPVVYLVDCSGLFLPEQSRSFSGRTGAGHIFTFNSRLAAAGVPQIAAVFGDCIAGGGYMPIISDRVIMTEGAYMVIAGAALIRGAKSLKLTSLSIGGPEVHVNQSSCADDRVPDDLTALFLIKEEIAKLPSSAKQFYRYGTDPVEPKFSPDEVGTIFPLDSRQIYDIEQVISRLVDGSLFHEFLPNVGREVVTGVARISGLWVGIIANRQGIINEPGVGKRAGGVLYREGISKLSTFSRSCSDDGLPVIWLQDISGFDIGVDAEHQGLLGYGSNLIYSNSTSRSPVFTVLLRKASGAGYYAMNGMPYEPVVQLATPLTRLAVMEGSTLSIAAYNSKLDDNFEIASTDPKERAAIEAGMKNMAQRIEDDMDPVKAASRMDVDEVVSLSELRKWLVCLTEAAWQSIGYRRTKNPRIWSLHDLEVLVPNKTTTEQSRTALGSADTLHSPTVGLWEPIVGVGAPVSPGTLLGHVIRQTSSVPVVAGKSQQGRVAEVLASGFVEANTAIVVLGELQEELSTTVREKRSENGPPEGTFVVTADTDGTFYARPAPDQPLFVEVGQKIESKTTLALVEVMKTFTPVKSPASGTVVRALVEDGQAVAADMPLFWIK